MGSPEVKCDQVLTHLWQYIDREIEADQCVKLEAHLATCDGCRRALENDRHLKRVVRRCCDEQPAVDRVEALVVRVRQRIQITLPPAD
jgi:anti-sigma factor (TIGR02949 family)